LLVLQVYNKNSSSTALICSRKKRLPGQLEVLSYRIEYFLNPCDVEVGQVGW